jgi:hypothetical protein
MAWSQMTEGLQRWLRVTPSRLGVAFWHVVNGEGFFLWKVPPVLRSSDEIQSFDHTIPKHSFDEDWRQICIHRVIDLLGFDQSLFLPLYCSCRSRPRMRIF